MRRTGADSGFTLVELMTVLAISGVIMAAVSVSIRDIVRTNSARKLITEVQGEGRSGLYRLQEEIREASLGSQSGAINVFDPNTGAVEPRPAVQLFDNVPGGGLLDVKPGTDAVLVFSAATRSLVLDAVENKWVSVPVQAQVMEANFDPFASPLKVTDVTGFVEGQFVLVGSYKSAGLFKVAAVKKSDNPDAPLAGELTLSAPANLFPGSRADVGAMVRVANSRLFYVDLNDRLVVRELTVVRAPSDEKEMGDPAVIAGGIENLQLDCSLDGGGLGYFEGCPAATNVLSIVNESAASGLATPRLDGLTVAGLRTVAVSAVIRSRTELTDQPGEPAVTMSNEPAPVKPSGVPNPDAQFARRSYRMVVGVRNTSLGNL